MYEEMITKQELMDAKEDARDLGDALNKKQIVVPRYGNPFNSLPLELDNLSKAIQIALAAGAGANGWTDWLIQTWSGRTQGDKNKELVSAQDFGATGDGVTNDTQAFIDLEAFYQGRIIDLLGKTYLVNETPIKNKYINGSFLIGGHTAATKENFKLNPLNLNLKSQLNDAASSLIWSWYLTSTWVAGADSNACQNIVFDERNRHIYGMFETGTYGGAAVLYRFPMDTGLDFNAPLWAADADTRIGHQGLALESNSDGATYLWASKRNSATNNPDVQAGCKVIRFRADNVPTYSTASDAVNEWSGRNGLYFENLQEFILFPLQDTEQNTNVTTSYDQKYLIAKMSEGSDYKIRIFDLDMLSKGGAGDYSNKYLNEFRVPLDGDKGVVMQDMASDGQYLYLYGGRTFIADGSTLVVQVYDLFGNHVSGYTKSDLGLKDSSWYLRPNNSSDNTHSESESINFVTINGVPRLTVHIASGTGGARPNLIFAVGGAYGDFRGSSERPALVLGSSANTTGVDLAGQRRKRLKIGSVSDTGQQVQNIVIEGSKITMGNGEDYGGTLKSESLNGVGYADTTLLGTASLMRRNSSSVTGARLALARSRNPNPLGSTILQNGDEVGGVHFSADNGVSDYTGSGGSLCALINATIDGTPSSIAMPSRINFWTQNAAGDYANRWQIRPNGDFIPSTTGVTNIGSASNLVNVIYASTGTINTSDERLKQQFRSQTDREKLAALEIKNSICLYKFNDAVDLKGDGARWHVGVKAQQVISILESHGLSWEQYGFVCFDEWEAQEEIIESWEDEYAENDVYNENGEYDGFVLLGEIAYKKGELIRESGSYVIQEHLEAGSRYAIRYDELAMFILSAI